ncbi:MAG: HD domain-containing protein [Chloroflexi bacterium]|nr:HD domain-containing protein [Chloroflexota bacterium]
MTLQSSSGHPLKEQTNKLREEVNNWLTEILASYEPRYIRDNKIVRDAPFGFHRFYKHEVNVIDSPLLQRLRGVHQTALTLLTYPSATHTRFEHSLGCTIVADRMMRAINEKKPTVFIENSQIAEVRLACLLHDCGHGPFSHASEWVYDKLSPELQDVRMEDQETFHDAAGHEMLSYFIVTSPRFKQLWDDIRTLYSASQEGLLCDLGKINLERVGLMILGLASEYPKYVAGFVNGPFDADKFDYIIRDGYFSGLKTSVDIDRVAVSLDVYEEAGEEPKLCMDIAGATVLEQLLFDKMVLFSSMYHHHKVRSSFRQLVRLFRLARDRSIRLGDADLKSAVGFLRLDDSTTLSQSMRQQELRDIADCICNRRLPKRVLVVSGATLTDAISKTEWVKLGADAIATQEVETAIERQAGIEEDQACVCIDFPPAPSIDKTARRSMIRLAPGVPLVELDALYPVAGWMSGYEEFRFKSYIFGPEQYQGKIAKAAMDVLNSRSIHLDFELAKQAAKWSKS